METRIPLKVFLRLTWRFGVLMLILGGCAVYSASSGRVDESIRHVGVQYLENLTTEPGIGVGLAEAITMAIQIDNTLKYVDETEADVVISGKVLQYSLNEVAARTDLTVTEYQIRIAVELSMINRETGAPIFSKKRFTGTGNYVLNDELTSEDTARNEAALEIVLDILALVVEDW